jgi:hypothetical protein
MDIASVNKTDINKNLLYQQLVHAVNLLIVIVGYLFSGLIYKRPPGSSLTEKLPGGYVLIIKQN